MRGMMGRGKSRWECRESDGNAENAGSQGGNDGNQGGKSKKSEWDCGE